MRTGARPLWSKPRKTALRLFMVISLSLIQMAECVPYTQGRELHLAWCEKFYRCSRTRALGLSGVSLSAGTWVSSFARELCAPAHFFSRYPAMVRVLHDSAVHASCNLNPRLKGWYFSIQQGIKLSGSVSASGCAPGVQRSHLVSWSSSPPLACVPAPPIRDRIPPSARRLRDPAARQSRDQAVAAASGMPLLAMRL